MTLGSIETGVGLVLAGLQVGVDELDESVQILSSDGFILLIEVVDVAVEDLNEELHGNGGVHAGVGDAKSSLETFKDSLPVAVELLMCE